MTIQVLMPALSPTMTEGKLARWLKKEGDTLTSGDVMAEIETDKATMEIEVVDEGTLGKILIPEGAEGVAVNSPIAIILEEGESVSDMVIPAPVATPSPTPEPTAPKPAAPSPAAPPPAAVNTGERIFASPLARRMAERSGLDLAAIKGSGPAGRVVKRDIEAAAASSTQSAPPVSAPPVTAVESPGGYTEVANSTMRKVIAKRLVEAKQTVPHFYLTIDCLIDPLLDMRRKLNAVAPEGEGGYKISVNDFIVRAVALALRRVPAANASWTDQAIHMYDEVDISIAVATSGGLITPVVRGADGKGLATISNEIKELAGRAHKGKLMPEEYRGGGFTVSNLGMYGIKDFAAIINPPQSCILAVGAGEQRPVVKDGALAIATVMTCTLSVDHRSVDGAIGARFLAAFKRIIEQPLTMML